MAWTDVETLIAQQDATNREAVRRAVKAGAKPLRCYRQEGVLILLVERADKSAGQSEWPLWCKVAAAKEAATLAWARQHGVAHLPRAQSPRKEEQDD